MKKIITLLMSLLMILTLAACSKSEDKPASDFEWTREGFFTDEEGVLFSITWMDDETLMEEDRGWYVGAMIGEDMYGNIVTPKGETLHGNIVPSYEEGEFVVTVKEEGEDGILVETADGTVYHLKKMDIPTATIFVNINTEGYGFFDYAREEDGLVFDEEYPATSAIVNLAEADSYILEARPGEGYQFVKWTKNGEDLSTEAIITETFDASADYIAVFEPVE